MCNPDSCSARQSESLLSDDGTKIYSFVIYGNTQYLYFVTFIISGLVEKITDINLIRAESTLLTQQLNTTTLLFEYQVTRIGIQQSTTSPQILSLLKTSAAAILMDEELNLKL